MGPTSALVLVGLAIAAIGGLVAVAIARHWVLQLTAGLLTLGVTLFTGAVLVNDYYGYYHSWGSALADLTGQGNSYAVHLAANDARASHGQHGRIMRIQLAGSRSGISREGLIYLPPQYDDPHYRQVRFPVIELLHGSPGGPASWAIGLSVNRYVDTLIATRGMGPVVLVMPASNRKHSFDECLDTGAVKTDTYLTQDVPTLVRTHFRVSTSPAQWGLMGYSSGGYCAANLMMRHRSNFGSSAIIDGYFHPGDGPAAADLNFDPTAIRANDPLLSALATEPGASPMPACWIAAGTGVAQDYAGAKAFAAATRRLTQTTLFTEPGAHHTVAAVRAAVPSALVWSWRMLASPDQRVLFPTPGSVTGSAPAITPTKPHQRRHHTSPPTPGQQHPPASLQAQKGANANGTPTRHPS